MNLKAILNRAPGEITQSRATRLTNVGIRTSDDYVLGLQKEKEALEEGIEDLLDLSARVDVNAGQTKISNTDIENIVTELHSKREHLYLVEQKLKVAKAVNEELKAEEITG